MPARFPPFPPGTVPGKPSALSAAPSAGNACLPERLPARTAGTPSRRLRLPPRTPFPEAVTRTAHHPPARRSGRGLTLFADGTAVYYIEDGVYSEPADPWVFEDGRLSITLSKLNCVITADVEGEDLSTLVFRSDSGNWDEETFRKLPKEEPKYLKGALRSFDRAVTVLPDGQMSLTFDGIRFTVPKHYLDYRDSYDKDKNTVILSEADTDTIYYGSLLFYNDAFAHLDTLDVRLNFQGFAKEFLYSFYYDVSLTDVKEETIAGRRAFTARFTGETNNGFSGATGLDAEGIVAFLVTGEGDHVLRLCFTQNADSVTDRMEEMERILYGAAPVTE